MRARPVVAAAASSALLLTGLLAGGAHAAWSSTARASAQTAAATLPAPDAVTAACAGTENDVVVTWTTTATSPVVAAFAVQRSNDAGATWTDLATVSASGATSYSYDDLAVPVGSYTYRVLAVSGGWSAVSANSPTQAMTEAKTGKRPRPITCN